MEIVTGWIHWIVNVSKLQRTSPNCRERPLIRKTGYGTRERETVGQKEGGLVGAMLYEKV